MPKKNTSRWTLYEQLGGPRARTFIAYRDVDDPSRVIDRPSYRVKRIGRYYVRVHQPSAKVKMKMNIDTFLSVLEETDGRNLDEEVFEKLLGKINGLRLENLKLQAQLDEKCRLADCRKQTIERFETESTRELFLYVYALLEDASKIAQRRGTRLSHLRSTLDAGLTNATRMAHKRSIVLP